MSEDKIDPNQVHLETEVANQKGEIDRLRRALDIRKIESGPIAND
jgi:hypothetical protein